jgi:hypothetical protein
MNELKAAIFALLEEKHMLIVGAAPSTEIDAIDCELESLMEMVTPSMV